MTKKSAAAFAHSEALIDGLEFLTLQDNNLEPLLEAEQGELARSMQLILAASAARAKGELTPPRQQRKGAGLIGAAVVKVAELRALLAPRESFQSDLAAALEADQESDDRTLDALIDDIERIMSSKRKV